LAAAAEAEVARKSASPVGSAGSNPAVRTNASLMTGDMSAEILTIGHSNHSAERFLALLRGAEVVLLIDVRSVPYSRRLPHFSRPQLETLLADAGIAYEFRGAELGGRPPRPDLFHRGVADYRHMAAEPSFHSGLARVREAATERRTALLCAERDPLDCHRALLVGRALAEAGSAMAHILADGSLEPQAAFEERLLRITGKDAPDLLASREARLAAAYHARVRRAAYRASH
jgi:hypothetical protein